MNETQKPKTNIIETAHGNFELVRDHREALDVKTFNDRYVDYLDRYPYIVGDVSAEILRLKGFSAKKKREIEDYLMESTTLNAPYFILRRMEADEKDEKS